MPNAITSTPRKQALFAMPSDASAAVEQELGALAQLPQDQLKLALNEHHTQVYSYDGRAAATLKIPGFADSSADANSKCLIFDQAHFVTKREDEYEYQFGWTQRLVIKMTSWAVKLDVTVPSMVAASCDLGATSALVQYVVRGLAGDTAALTGNVSKFGVDEFVQYQVKMQKIFEDLDNGKMTIVPVVIARERAQDAADVDVRDLYRGYAYRLSGLAGILANRTADDFFTYVTTQGKDRRGHAQKIADERYFRLCLEAAYSDYGIKPGGRLSDDRSPPEQEALKNRIIGDTDGFAAGRHGFNAT